MNKEAVGLNIRLARVKENLTQEQLAERADISSSYISAIERGKQSISLEYINRIAGALNLPVTDLLVNELSSGYMKEEQLQQNRKEEQGTQITRQKKMNQIMDLLMKCGDEEFQIVYDEILLMINKFHYFSDRGIK